MEPFTALNNGQQDQDNTTNIWAITDYKEKAKWSQASQITRE